MRNFRILIVLTIVLSGALAGVRPAAAQDAVTPEALQAARDLVSIMSGDTMRQATTQVTAQVWPSIERGLRSKRANITAAQLTELRAEFERIQYEFLVKMMEDAPAIYARYFTAAELREMLAFYKSPIGEKALRVLPQVMSETMSVMMPRMQQIQNDTMDAFTKVLRQRGFDL